ncbi:MAG: phosphoenolpyruvate--protein phosphotransferase [Spirochaetes bacterium]|nr:phosphoenolpyruvate--protein phosphotransferase [Spirochaetota bacterium]
MMTLKGIPVSPGIAIGKAHIFDEEKYIIPKYKIELESIQKEITKFNQALQKTKNELKKIQKVFTDKIKNEKLDFFKMHLLILDDPYLKDSVLIEIAENNKNAEWALYDVMSKHINSLSNIEDEYLSERVADLYDLAKRIMKNLLKKRENRLSDIEGKAIIIAKNLAPSDTVDMEKSKIIGFATDFGGRTSHTAIVSRALEIPAVIGLEDVSSKVHEGDNIIVDGSNGIVIINPEEGTLKEYQTAYNIFQKYSEELKKIKSLDSITLDKKRIKLAGNIEIREEIESVINHGGQGIGLFRTEFLYLNRTTLPTEKELFAIFKEAAEKTKPNAVIYRTLDIGGDKFGEAFKITDEMNPFLGYRAIRFCLENPEIFNTQLSAIIKAAYYGNGAIMIPMISSVDEIIKVKEMIGKLEETLTKNNEKFTKDIKIGAMIEIPSAAITIDIISKEVDFISIGTNDLVQYTLAVDRNNSKISHLYEPFHPAVLRLIKTITDSAHKNNIPVHVCGELAAEAMATILFVGMDIDELSMSAIAIPEIKKLIRSIRYKDAKILVNKVLKLNNAIEIKNEIRKFISKNTPEFLYKDTV